MNSKMKNKLIKNNLYILILFHKMILTIFVCIMFIQRILRNYLNNHEIHFHTLSEYCNEDIITKIFLVINIILSGIYVLYNDFSYYMIGACCIYFGILCKTNCKLWKYIWHYTGGTTLIIYNFYIVWNVSRVLYFYIINLVVFGVSSYSTFKMVAFIAEGVFLSMCSYYLVYGNEINFN